MQALLAVPSGRAAWIARMAAAQGKPTDEQRRASCALKGVRSRSAIAKDYGLDESTVRRIWRNAGL